MLTLPQSVSMLMVAEEAHHAELPFPAWVFGVGMFVVLAVLGFVTMSYTNVHNKHAEADGSTGMSTQHGKGALGDGHR